MPKIFSDKSSLTSYARAIFASACINCTKDIVRKIFDVYASSWKAHPETFIVRGLWRSQEIQRSLQVTLFYTVSVNFVARHATVNITLLWFVYICHECGFYSFNPERDANESALFSHLRENLFQL